MTPDEAVKAIMDQMTDVSSVQDAFDVLIEAASGEWKTKYDQAIVDLEAARAESAKKDQQIVDLNNRYKERFLSEMGGTGRSDVDVNEQETPDDVLFNDIDWEAATE